MSLPNYSFNENINNVNDIQYINNPQMNTQQQPQAYPHPQFFFNPEQAKQQSFSFPPPPPGFIVPPFEREISPPRKRTRTTPEQLVVLEKSFSLNPSPNSRIREQLSLQLGMPERSIQIWFQNRRAKLKNQARKKSQTQDKNIYMQQQYAANAAAAACQTAALQQNQDTIDPNMYYYYYYYYFNQQQRSMTPTAETADAVKNGLSIAPPPPPPSSYSTPTSWNPSMNTIVPDLTLSASSSSSSITSDNHHPYHRRYHHHRSSSGSSSERIRAHSVGPYPYYRKPTPQERHSSLGPLPTTSYSNSLTNSTNNIHASRTTIQPHQLMFAPSNDSRLYNSSTIIEETFQTAPSGTAKHSSQPKYNLSVQSLQIGTWKRVSDLHCEVDLTTRTLSWCISDDQQNFRIDINVNLVQFIRINQVGALYRIEFFLSTPSQVKFFMAINNDWVQCHDFTQDKQATVENVHVLEGFELLHSEFMEILMQAPDLQSLVIQDDEQQHTTLYGDAFITHNSSSQSLDIVDTVNNASVEEEDSNGSNDSSENPKPTTDEKMKSNLLLLQSLHLPQ